VGCCAEGTQIIGVVSVADQSDDRVAAVDQLSRQELTDLPVGAGNRTSHPQ
jgi:hypothetical protein